MKRCPVCQTSYTDASQRFCLNDGAVLVDESSGSYDPQATLISQPSTGSIDLQKTQASFPGGGSQGGWTPPPPPPSQQAYSPAPQPKRKIWPWVVGGLAVVVVGVVVLGIVGLMALGSLVENSNTTKVSNSSNSNVSSTSKTKRDTDASANVNSTNLNSTTPTVNSTDAPTDHDVVMSDLSEIEEAWLQANVDGDKRALRDILSNDYVGTASDGSVQSKAEYLDAAKPDENVKTWETSDLKLSLSGNTAVLTGMLKWVTTSGTERYRFTDSFAWQDGRWQAVSSQASLAK
jgi:hypothetical protein